MVATIAAALPLYAAAADLLPPRPAIKTTTLIDPFDIKGNSFAQQLSPQEREHARTLFQALKQLAAQQKSVARPATSGLTLLQAPAAAQAQAAGITNTSIVTKDGTALDATLIFQFVNDLERRLNRRGYSMRSDDLKTIPMQELYPDVRDVEKPTAHAVQPAAAAAAASTPPPPSASSTAPKKPSAVICQTPAVRPSPDVTKAWNDIQKAAFPTPGSKIDRCDWDFESEVRQAESGAPLVPAELPVAQFDPNFGQVDMGPATVALVTHFAPNASRNASGMLFTSSLVATFENKPHPIGTFTLTINAPKNGEQRADIKLDVAGITAYNTTTPLKDTTSGGPMIVKDLDYDVAPKQDFDLFSDIDHSFHFGPLSVRFRVSGKGHVGEHVIAHGASYGYFVDTLPDVYAKISGGPSIEVGVLGGGIDTSVNVVKLTGEAGALGGLFVDTTAPSDVVAPNPTVTVSRTWGSMDFSAGNGNVTAYIYLTFMPNKKLLSNSWHFDGVHRTANLNDTWHAYYVAPGAPSK